MNKAINVSCTVCRAEPGSPCRDWNETGTTVVDIAWFHYPRMLRGDETGGSR